MSERRYMELLSQKYGTVSQASERIISLQAMLDLPKGTEHFVSDIHGEYEAFYHLINSCSGVILEKVRLVLGSELTDLQLKEFATLIYYPTYKLDELERKGELTDEYYRVTISRLMEVCRVISGKYTRHRVRHAMPKEFRVVLDELLHQDISDRNKDVYYERLITTMIDLKRATEFIIAISKLCKTLAVDKLHVLGDLFDRGPAPDKILDLLMEHPNVDIQWGNHDVLWMGAAAGSEACMLGVIYNSLRYGNLEVLETGYGISLRVLSEFARETYRPSEAYRPKTDDAEDLSPLMKATAILMFKAEGQLIGRHPRYLMDDRLLLSKVNYDRGSVTIDGEDYPLKDPVFETVDPREPYVFTPEERMVVASLKQAFLNSEKLQKHTVFLYRQGSMYKVSNGNLLFHGCIPLTETGDFETVSIGGNPFKGKALMDKAESRLRQAYFAPEGSFDRENCLDFAWYLWCGKGSPVFGRSKAAVFEGLLVEDEALQKEEKNPYYTLSRRREVCESILAEFGLAGELTHIINGHVPVRAAKGESPIKADGKLLVIDGGFAKTYHRRTGIAGYTLIFNSHGMRLIAHEAFTSIEDAVKNNRDIHSTVDIFETAKDRIRQSGTDEGQKIILEIEELKDLLGAYRLGELKESDIWK